MHPMPGPSHHPEAGGRLISYLDIAHDSNLPAPALVKLMSSPDASTREEAALALRSMIKLKDAVWDHWQPTWPATLDISTVTDAMITGLDDSDERVRYMCVCTLMEINLDPHYPSVSKFKDNEQTYLDNWRAWAKSRAAKVPTP